MMPMLAVLGAGAYMASAYVTLAKDAKSKKEKVTVKKRSPERALRAVQTILTVLGERIEELEAMLDGAMARLEEGAVREAKLVSESRNLEGQLSTMTAERENHSARREQFAQDAERLRDTLRIRDEELRTSEANVAHLRSSHDADKHIIVGMMGAIAGLQGKGKLPKTSKYKEYERRALRAMRPKAP